MNGWFTLIAIMLSYLGANEFGTRERASRGLAEIQWLASFHLELGLKAYDAETRRRCEILIESAKPAPIPNPNDNMPIDEDPQE